MDKLCLYPCYRCHSRLLMNNNNIIWNAKVIYLESQQFPEESYLQ